MAAFLLVLFAILNRVWMGTGSHAPHLWWNFTAVGGSLLFFGARRSLRQAWIPVLALMATDFFLTKYAYGVPFRPQEYLVTWAWYVGAILLGWWLLRSHASVGRVVGASFLSATTFFLVSNFNPIHAGAALYPLTASGLMQSFVAGVPFYRNDLVSTLLVTGLAFGALALVRQRQENTHGVIAG
jgi:hypothetical protein